MQSLPLAKQTQDYIVVVIQADVFPSLDKRGRKLLNINEHLCNILAHSKSIYDT